MLILLILWIQMPQIFNKSIHKIDSTRSKRNNVVIDTYGVNDFYIGNTSFQVLKFRIIPSLNFDLWFQIATSSITLFRYNHKRSSISVMTFSCCKIIKLYCYVQNPVIYLYTFYWMQYKWIIGVLYFGVDIL